LARLERGQRPGQDRPAALRALARKLRHQTERLAELLARRKAGEPALLDRLLQDLELELADRLAETLLAWKVVEHGRPGHVRAVRDLVDRDRVEAALDKQVQGCQQDLAPRFPRPALASAFGRRF